MASLPIVCDDIMTYGSIDSGGGCGGDAGGHTRPSNIRRPRQRTISTAEVVDEIERFGRSTDRLIRKRTISYCQPPDLDSLPELDRQCSENEENNATSGGGAGLNEFGEREDELSISNFETIIHILKGNIGIGVLTLPMAIRNSGLIFGSIGLLLIAYICVYCMTLLVKAAHKALRNRENVLFLDYADTAKATFIDAGGNWLKCASFIRKLLNTFLCLSQLLSNAVYVLFIAQNIKPIIAHYGGPIMENLNYRFYILMVLPPMLAICSIRSLRYLSPCSIVANVCQFVGLGIVFYYIFDALPNSNSVAWVAKADRLPLFFGTAIFAIEGISVVLPIENQMRRPKDMLGW